MLPASNGQKSVSLCSTILRNAQYLQQLLLAKLFGVQMHAHSLWINDGDKQQKLNMTALHIAKQTTTIYSNNNNNTKIAVHE